MADEQLLGPLPRGWAYTTLGAACLQDGTGIQTGPFGSQLHASDYVPTGIPSVMPQNIGDNRINVDGIAHISVEDAVRLSRYLVREGDIVYSRRGDVEKRALIRASEDGWLCGTGCLRVRVIPDVVDSRYASYCLAHPRIRDWIVRHAHGATMPNLNTSILAACPLAIPPLSEQRAIAHTLGTLDDKIEVNRRMNKTLEAMAQALFKSWFVDFAPVRAKMEGHDPGLPLQLADLFPGKLIGSELGEIPKGWKVKTLGEIAEVTSGKRPNSRIPTASGEARVPVWGGNGPMAFTSEALLNGPALVTGRVGTLGSVFRVTRPCWPSDNTLIVKSAHIQSVEFLFLHMQRIDFESLNRGSTQPLVSQTDLKAVRFAYPSMNVLSRLGPILATLYARMDANDDETLQLAAVRDALLPKLISGELRVKGGEKFVGRIM